MRAFVIPFMALACMATGGEAEVEPAQPEEPTLFEEYQKQLKDLKKRDFSVELARGSVLLKSLRRSNCRDRLEDAQVAPREGGEAPVILQPGPLLRSGPSTPETPPLAIYAFDHREGGCGMMVMMGNRDDVRPLPELDADDHRLMPADALNGE